jgi:DNA polymerase III delta subunit
LEAAFAGNVRRALALYEEQRALKVEPAQIIAMLAWQLHVLAVIKTAGSRSTDQIAKEAKLNPFVVRKSQAIANKTSLTGLKRLIADLLEIDVKTKRTSIDADEALQHYLLKLSPVTTQ